MVDPFPPVTKPVIVPTGATSMVLATLDQAAGADAVRKAVTSGFLRPFDIARADITAPRPVWVPFWRVQLSVQGLTVDGSHPKVPFVIAARRAFPFVAKLPSLGSRLAGKTPFDMMPADTVPADMAVILENGATILEADVDREDAILAAKDAFLSGIAPVGLPDRYAPEIEGAAFVLYPVYYATYTYHGEARRDASDRDFFVAVSGRTGELLASTHPSPIRALAAKLRRALSFDRRV